MARDEVGFSNEIRRANGLGSKAQMRSSNRATLFRVINEVALHVIVRARPDDLDGILVRAHGAIRAEPIEQRADRTRVFGGERRIVVQTGVGDVILNPDREFVLGPCLLELVEDALHHGRREFLRGNPIAPANYARVFEVARARSGKIFAKRGDNILIKRFTQRARLLGAIEHGNRSDSQRQRCHKGLCSERPIQPHLQQAKLLSPRVQMADSFFNRARARSHNNDHAFGIRCAHVVE